LPARAAGRQRRARHARHRRAWRRRDAARTPARRRDERLMADLVMPRLSDTMEEGTILRWLKHDGDDLRRGDELVEIETDKANMIYESDLDGTLQTVAA